LTGDAWGEHWHTLGLAILALTARLFLSAGAGERSSELLQPVVSKEHDSRVGLGIRTKGTLVFLPCPLSCLVKKGVFK